jgi:hypothetical protein
LGFGELGEAENEGLALDIDLLVLSSVDLNLLLTFHPNNTGLVLLFKITRTLFGWVLLCKSPESMGLGYSLGKPKTKGWPWT